MYKTSDSLTVAALVVSFGVGILYFVDQARSKASQHSVEPSTQSNATCAIPSHLLALPLGRELEVAVDLAIQAGNAIYRYCDEKGTLAEERHELGITTKGQPEDFCTKIDVENERLVMSGILKQFPNHKVIGEETTGTGSVPPLTTEPTWIIDPIDGTTNFASGLPLCCVSIGLCVNGRPVLGVVYVPMTQELYLGIQGHGAYRNGVRLSNRTNDRKLVDSVVCFEFGYSRATNAIAQCTGVVQRILQHGCRATRSLGSGVLDLCYVASGRMDVVYAGVANEGWKPWDYCAGSVIATETNCAIEPIYVDSNTSPHGFDLYSKSIICAVGPSLLQEIRSIITS